jgi:endo-1,4-beta-xylanase
MPRHRAAHPYRCARAATAERPTAAPAQTVALVRSRAFQEGEPSMKLLRILAVSTLGAALLVAGQLAGPRSSAAAGPTLRELAAARGIQVGAAVDTNALANEAGYRDVLAREYSSVTAENAMKWDAVEPQRGVFNFAAADSLVTFASANGQVIRGHTLVWHNQLPSYVSSSLGAAGLTAAMHEHIDGEMAHWRGQISAWDVVNEAFNEDGTLRQSVWLTTIGSGYIADAFREARAQDPAARLYINDFNIEGVNAKSNALFALVRDLRAAGVPIDGVGFQTHLTSSGLPSGFQQNLQRFSDLGVDVSITEADVRLPLPSNATSLATQATIYGQMLQACLAVPRCVSFTTWGFTDAHSWVPSTFPGQGDALPFDANLQPKPAYTALQQALGFTPPTTTLPPTTIATTTTAPTTTVPAAAACQVAYRIQTQWQDGFVADVTIRNTGTTTINGWTITWSFPGNQRITSAWNAFPTQSGQSVSATDGGWNAVIPPSGTAPFGFQATYSATNPPPTAFTLNGTTCAVI